MGGFACVAISFLGYEDHKLLPLQYYRWEIPPNCVFPNGRWRPFRPKGFRGKHPHSRLLCFFSSPKNLSLWLCDDHDDDETVDLFGLLLSISHAWRVFPSVCLGGFLCSEVLSFDGEFRSTNAFVHGSLTLYERRKDGKMNGRVVMFAVWWGEHDFSDAKWMGFVWE